MAEYDAKDPSTKRLWIAVMVAIIGGNSGSFINALTPAVRNDPMTGSEGREISRSVTALRVKEARLEARLESLTELLRQHMRNTHRNGQ